MSLDQQIAKVSEASLASPSKNAVEKKKWNSNKGNCKAFCTQNCNKSESSNFQPISI